MSYPLPDKLLQLPDITIKQLMKKVAAYQNGDVSRAMKKMGFNYPINYGVVIPQLRALANHYQPHHSLAIQLRQHSKIREALILSSMLDEPEKIEINEAIEICDIISNIELAEQFAQNLFAHIPNLIFFVRKIEGKSEIFTTLCFLSLGWGLKLKKEFSESDIDWIISKIERFDYLTNDRNARAIQLVMQAISDYSVNSAIKIKNMAVKLSKSDNSLVAKIGDEFLWLNSI